jgi:hypothetical protein
MVSQDIAIPCSPSSPHKHAQVCEELSAPQLDFAHQFVGRPFQRTVEVCNQGRRAADIAWTSAFAEDVKQRFTKAARATGRA